MFLFLYQQFSNKVGTSGNLITQFQEEYNYVLRLLQSFSFCPENLPLTTSTKKPTEKKTLEKQTSKKQIQGPVSFLFLIWINTVALFLLWTGDLLQPNCSTQTDEHRTALLAHYGPETLFQAERNFNAAQDLDISIQEGDLVGVIKQQDPMGSQNRWLIDNGGNLCLLSFTANKDVRHFLLLVIMKSYLGQYIANKRFLKRNV